MGTINSTEINNKKTTTNFGKIRMGMGQLKTNKSIPSQKKHKRKNYRNIISTIQILESKNDPITSLQTLGDNYLLSFTDEGGLTLWNHQDGIKLFDFPSAHNSRITSAIFLPTKSVLVTGSLDTKLKIWDASENGKLVKTLHNHQKPVRILLQLSDEFFCSAGDDDCILIWDSQSMEILSKIPINIDQSLLETPKKKQINKNSPNNYFSSSSVPVNTTLFRSKPQNLLGGVRKIIHLEESQIVIFREHSNFLVVSEVQYNQSETIGILEGLSGEIIDVKKFPNSPHLIAIDQWGRIIVWHTNDKIQIAIGSASEKVIKVMQSSINLTILDQQQFAVSFGNRLSLFRFTNNQIIKTKLNISIKNAPITHLISIFDGDFLVTYSLGGALGIWKTADINGDEDEGNGNNGNNKKPNKQIQKKSINKGDLSEKALQYCVEMVPPINTGMVNQLVPLNYHSFATCSSDNLVILWKDSIIHQEYLNSIARNSILQYNSEQIFYENFSYSEENSSSEKDEN
ncbi:wdr41-related [Anaeramoeba flamelloides]|uniref:Wdr41-related n=1 Tax=Anaeramoeba flamelloides TaxID=1746091 RepID=A0AAV8AE20_9EUKA|nr:wdr41-related [Anaeramoeba flamelloides]